MRLDVTCARPAVKRFVFFREMKVVLEHLSITEED